VVLRDVVNAGVGAGQRDLLQVLGRRIEPIEAIGVAHHPTHTAVVEIDDRDRDLVVREFHEVRSCSMRGHGPQFAVPEPPPAGAARIDGERNHLDLGESFEGAGRDPACGLIQHLAASLGAREQPAVVIAYDVPDFL